MSLSDTEIAELEELEAALWARHTRFDETYMRRLMSENFFEFGRSGRRYSRAECLAFPDQELNATLRDIDVHEIAPAVALVTYVSEVRYSETQVSYRSSLWVRSDAGWQLRFHQGTPTDATGTT
ncbi:nuclear transport factor 2 family protein [Haloechinothrix halophila]|uniref:nuclear transport factor 2 family protein n=1 Tax=Haloechinothrix halophila TaxID=1069073 RepID=UPI000421BD8B|nr:DUF4440 domain-containing protein [Haloechinothrix halophila]